MQKFLSLLVIFTIAVIMSGCNPPVTPTQGAVSTLPLANVTCNELSLYLDPALGSGYECETVPESSSSDIPAYHVFIYPAHTELTIKGYPLSQTQFPPQIWIYPVDRFVELLPDILPERLSNLKSLIADGSWSSKELPFLPAIPQIQTFFIHKTDMAFNDGQGVRFITEYSESPTPITNKNIIYTFQGLTDDGMDWVAVILPISSPILPADYDTLPEGYTMESLIQSYQSYASEVKEALEKQAPGSFSPTLDSLDSLVKSITIRR